MDVRRFLAASTGMLGLVTAAAVAVAPAANSGAPAAIPATAPTSAPAAAPAAVAGAVCLDREDAVLTVEEQRLESPLVPGGEPVAAQFLRGSGFDQPVAEFEAGLCGIASLDDAAHYVREGGADLWRRAVDRAQGRTKAGTVDRYDDRPLYWSRLRMTRALRQWQPDFEVTGTSRGALLRMLDYASRGIDSVEFPSERGTTRVLVSGFDTFRLDLDLRNANPSGASALQLDGRRVQTAGGMVVVQAVMLPVNWTDFDQGVVEDAFGPSLEPGGGRADLIMTISQGARGVMEVEKWAGGFRGGSPDNNLNQLWGPVSRPAHWPQPYDSPQWIRTTLPYEEMIEAGTGPWPVSLDDNVCEWPAGTFPDPTKVRCRSDPSPGSSAAAGGGGDYLSNESMYRSNRLRLGIGAWNVPGGHLHISALVYPEDKAQLTSPAFEADRRATVDQTVALVEAAGRAAD